MLLLNTYFSLVFLFAYFSGCGEKWIICMFDLLFEAVLLLWDSFQMMLTQTKYVMFI